LISTYSFCSPPPRFKERTFVQNSERCGRGQTRIVTCILPTNQVCAALKALPGVTVLHSTVTAPLNTSKMARAVPIKSATPRVGLPTRNSFDDTVVAAASALNTLAVVSALTDNSGQAAVACRLHERAVVLRMHHVHLAF